MITLLRSANYEKNAYRYGNPENTVSCVICAKPINRANAKFWVHLHDNTPR